MVLLYPLIKKRGYNESFLTIFWQIPFILLPLSNKKFCGLMVRRPAFHTEIRGSIPLFLVFQKKASASVVQKPPIPTNFHYYLQDLQSSIYIFNLYFFGLMSPHRCSHWKQKKVFYLMNLLSINRVGQKWQRS
jgi:hypothetical protein